MSGQKSGGVQQHLKRSGSSVRKYQQAVIGRDSWIALVMYEFIACCATPVPGFPGKLLRALLYPLLFGSYALSARTGKNLTIHQPARISFAPRVVVGDMVTLNVKGEGAEIILHEDVHVGENCIFSCPGGKIEIGDGTVIGAHCRLGSLEGLSIGRRCRIGERSYLIGAAHAFDRVDVPIIRQLQTCRGKTSIGDHVTIGCDVTILDGVRIGDHACIADGALVLRDVPDSAYARGVPAVVVATGG